MAASRPVRTLLLVVMDVLVFIAIVLVLRVVVQFFGSLAVASWGKQVVHYTRFLVIPFGVKAVTTPYGGSFDTAATVTVVVLLGVEWALGLARGSE